jgi:hypothetical protein
MWWSSARSGATSGKGKIVDWLSSGRCGGALPGRPQCRSYARHRRHRLQALAAAIRYRAPGQALGDRQRRGRRPAWPSSRKSPGCAPRASRSPREPAHRRQCDADPAAAPRTRPFRETSNSALKIGTTKRGIGPAYEDKVGRRAIRVIDLKDEIVLKAKIERLLDPPQRAAPWPRHRRDRRRRSAEELTEIAPQVLPYGRSGPCSTLSAAPASASCSRARRAPCSTSTTAPIPS